MHSVSDCDSRFNARPDGRVEAVLSIVAVGVDVFEMRVCIDDSSELWRHCFRWLLLFYVCLCSRGGPNEFSGCSFHG